MNITTTLKTKSEKLVPSMRVILFFPTVLAMVLGGVSMLAGNANGVKFLIAGVVTFVLVLLGQVLVPLVNKAYFTMLVHFMHNSNSK